ncbi:MAG: protein kinase [Muribaculaceae bacterium]|nr:protein kinase [Muribaculaceae bacterium]
MYELAKGTLLVGKNKYVVEEVLGQGSFGFTYVVSAMIMTQNIPVKTRFAVKEFFLRSHCMRDPDDHCTMTYAAVAEPEVQRFQRDFRTEAQRLVKICETNRKLGSEAAFTNHHIVPVNECFDANGTSYFVMEYLSGGSLRNRVERDGAMSEENALSYIRPIADAVAFLHEHRVLHMDIKPDNIVMRSVEGMPDVPMLIDFGISLHFDDKGLRTTLSSTSGLTPGYSPLEQSQPLKAFDPRADVYALGATLFFLLTGNDPASAAEVNETYLRSTLPADVSERTRAAIIHAMQPLRAHRTPTANDFLHELEDTATDTAATNSKQAQDAPAAKKPKPAQHEPVQGTRIVGEPATRKPLKINVKLIAAIVVGVCLVAAAAIFIPRWVNSRPAADIEQKDSIAAPGDTTTSVAPVTIPGQQPATTDNTLPDNNTKTAPPKPETPNTETGKQQAVKPETTKPATDSKTEVKKPENDNNIEVGKPEATATAQADQQARALLSKLQAGGQPSGADMKRLNSLRDKVSPDVRARIDQFNEKWGY